MTARLTVGIAALLLCACQQNIPLPPPAPAPAPPPSAEQQFIALAQRYLQEFPEHEPVSATGLGDHRFDQKLDEVNAAAWESRALFDEIFLTALSSIDQAALSRGSQVDAVLLRHQLEYDRWKIQTLQDWRWNPLLYTSLVGDGLYGLLARDFAPLPERMRNLRARLDELPRFLTQVREVLEPARVPKVHAETAARQNSGLISLLDVQIVQALANLPEADQAALRTSIGKARSALAQHQIWLEKRLTPEAKGDFRLGAELYDQKLAFALFSPLTRAQIRERAEAQLSATRAQMYEVAREVLRGRRGRSSAPANPSATQQQRAIAAALELAYLERPQRDAVLDTARTMLDDTTRFVREKQLVTVPPEPVEIIAMPEFQQGVALAYCDSPGPLESGQKTFYAVSPIPTAWTRAQTESFLREYNTRSIANLTVHEAMPGHYLQLAHANKYPSALRAVLASPSFVEGWAVYSEKVMVDAGYMNGDALMRLIQLKWYLRSIVNALLDQAVHVDGISREAAMKLMTQSGFQEEREAAAKWTRAQLTSAQLPVYFVGSQEHLALRAEAEQRAGANFVLQVYHDNLLSFGSPPVRFARALLFDLPIETGD